MRSFLSVNYALRLNKAIERRLMFRALDRIRGPLAWKEFTYYGLGSMWFMDFHMAHRTLGVERLVSFERDAHDAARATSNRPLRTIEVKDGEIGERLSEDDIGRRKALLWLDFDQVVDAQTVSLLRNLCETLSDKSVLIVSLPARPPNGVREEKLGELRELFGDAAPPSVSNKYFDSHKLRNYPKNLTNLLWALIQESGNKRADGIRPMRLFSFVYGDSQSMSTIGVVFGTPETKKVVESALDATDLEYVGDQVTELDVPLLTAREKGALDRLLPSPGKLTDQAARDAGVFLPQQALESYRNWYADYPIFAEVELR